ncbi:protein-disulfide reductase DsbD family protein [Thiocapsa imhoffii]|nr:protein-disulfide reductase DsbD domain-containing protein [Thiocapsa imhoffii]
MRTLLRCSHGRLLAFLLLLAWPWFGHANPVTTDHVTLRLVAERTQVAPGSQVTLALVFEIAPGWHTYWRNPGDSGEPPRVTWTLPEGVSIGPMQWPRPELIPVGPLANYGYSDQAVHLFDLTLAEDWPVGDPVRLRADADWLVCEEYCVPESATLALTLASGDLPGPLDQTEADVVAATRAALPRATIDQAVLVAAPAGLRLEVPRQSLPLEITGAWFFAGEWGLIDHAAMQPWRLTTEALQLELSPGVRAEQAAPEGVLVVADTAGNLSSFDLQVTRTAALTSGSTAPPISLPLALLFALIGGLILNLMPCVFPVLAMKALSLVNSLTAEGPAGARVRRLDGLAYTAGVLVFFLALAVILLSLRAAGLAVGWGFQLQYAPFVAVMVYVFFVFGLSLAGAFTLGARLMAIGGQQVGYAGAFGTGALAALVAAPCTAPFMGVALGYAVTLSWPLALAIMLTLGFGLALPFLVLSWMPRLARVLPKPGAWMETLKQVLAFPMFGAAAWLLWVLSVQTGPAGIALVLTGLMILAFGLWLRERTQVSGPAPRRLGGLAAGLAVVSALYLAVATDAVETAGSSSAATSGSHLPSEDYSPARLAAARAAGQPVLVNMTAAWCITCLVNERVALSSPALAQRFAASGVLYLKGDWTNRDPAITSYLAEYGRNGVPLYVYYPPNGSPEVLPQILTEEMVSRVLP